MSLTSYRAAPPRVTVVFVPGIGPAVASFRPHWIMFGMRKGRLRRPLPPLWRFVSEKISCVSQTWQRLTLPRLETKYHQRWSVSRPSSEWDRVQPLRHNHQVGEKHVREAGLGWAVFAPCPVFVPRAASGVKAAARADRAARAPDERRSLARWAEAALRKSRRSQCPTATGRKSDCASPVVRRPRGA